MATVPPIQDLKSSQPPSEGVSPAASPAGVGQTRKSIKKKRVIANTASKEEESSGEVTLRHPMAAGNDGKVLAVTAAAEGVSPVNNNAHMAMDESGAEFGIGNSRERIIGLDGAKYS